MRRVIVFWDFSNFDATLRELERDYPARVRFDYEKFVRHLVGDNELVKVYFATSSTGQSEALQSFFDAVDHMPFFYVKTFRRSEQEQTGRVSEKQVDTYLATQMVALAYENAYDIAILISGDLDFLPAVEIVQQKGKVVVAVSAGRSISNELKRRADRFVLIDRAGEGHYREFLAARAN